MYSCDRRQRGRANRPEGTVSVLRKEVYRECCDFQRGILALFGLREPEKYRYIRLMYPKSFGRFVYDTKEATWTAETY